MRTLLVTVGASLLANAARDRGKDFKALTDEDLTHYLRTTDPVRASAETNSLSRLLQEGDRLILLHSDTPEGERCALHLSRFYRRQGYQTEIQCVPNLNYQESRFKIRGLRSLVSKICDLVQREQKAGREVLINATGGFKAEIAYATLVGLLFRVSVHYIHEKFRDIVDMPPVPISWDYSLLADYEDFFKWINEDLRVTEEVEHRLRGVPPEIRMLLTEEEGFTYLSPLGEVFYRAFQLRMDEVSRTTVLLSDSALSRYKTLQTNEKKQIEGYFRRLRLPEWRARNSRQPAKADCLVALRGRTEWRILYYEEEGILRVLEILRHDEYERKIEQGFIRDRYQKFYEWKG